MNLALAGNAILRYAIQKNLVSFPAQIPTFGKRGDAQKAIVALYFLRGWGSASIGRRYALHKWTVKNLLDGWRTRAIGAGYIQDVYPEFLATITTEGDLFRHDASEDPRLDQTSLLRIPLGEWACRLNRGIPHLHGASHDSQNGIRFPAARPAQPKRRNILIAGDDTGERRLLHSTLSNLGFDCEEAASGVDAIALSRIRHFAAILLDMRLSGESDIDTYVELRRLVPSASILLLGVDVDQDRKVELLGAGIRRAACDLLLAERQTRQAGQ